MSEITTLDAAHNAMQADESDGARLRFFERIAESELFLLLDKEATDESLSPQVFPVEGQNFVLAFDREARLLEFVGSAAPYVGLSGRALASMLKDQEIGLGLNLGVAPSSILLPTDAISWLADTSANAPEEMAKRVEEILPPAGLPEALITALDSKLALAAGLARAAYLAGVRYEGGIAGHMLAFLETVPGAESSLSQAVAEALTFSGIEAGVLDVSFFRATDPLTAPMARHGLKFDLPLPIDPEAQEIKAPGSDPDKPPRLI